jgi:hypothetical protein
MALRAKTTTKKTKQLTIGGRQPCDKVSRVLYGAVGDKQQIRRAGVEKHWVWQRAATQLGNLAPRFAAAIYDLMKEKTTEEIQYNE